MRTFHKVVACIIVLFLASSVQAAQKTDKQFIQWLTEFSKQAEQQGISKTTINRALGHLTAPDPRVLKKANYQPEFTLEIWDYLDPRVNQITIKQGKKMEAKYASTLNAIEKKLGVSKHIILAIWSMETAYGAILEKKTRLHSVPHALATLAYADKKRSKFGKSQLMAALKILDAGDIPHHEMLGSWAGAMGHTQFIPTSYLAYGLDWDKDGRRDIWSTIPDALATAGNLLKQNGWRTGKTWGYEVYDPPNGYNYNDQTKTLAQWSKLGFKRAGNKQFPRPDEKAELKYIGGQEGPAYLMIKNFFVIKRYNNSNFYALAVGQLADQLAGFGGMEQDWPRPAGSLSIDQKFELQSLLKKGGFYDGEIDGQLGGGSKKGIKAFQHKYQLKVTGKPSLKLLKQLRLMII